MYKIDFCKPETIHFIGIGGISMSGLAEILLEEGFCVSGSDSQESDLTKRLQANGVRIYYGQKASNITDDIDVVVFTAAVHEDNEEFQAARNKGVPMLTRAELLGQMMKNYENAIAISGTHGKTTTTSMVTEIFLEADSNPTISVGGILNSIGGNIRVGGPEFFVTEACEYTNSFLSFYPTMGVILNIAEDHLDFFKDLEDIRNSFRRFAKRIPENGTLVVSSDIQDYEEIVDGLACKVITCGKQPEKSKYSAGNITYDKLVRPTFDLLIDGERVETITLSVTGEYNVYNALAAIAVAHQMQIPAETIKAGLRNFTGTKRRFEKKGEIDGITIIDDYAHHPEAIEVTLHAAESYPHNKIWCVFQPHTYTRTKALMDDFAKSLSMADSVILADIYAARESDTLGVCSLDIVKKIEELGTPAYYFPTFEEIEKFILEKCVPGDLLITMGAGDIVKVGEKLLSR